MSRGGGGSGHAPSENFGVFEMAFPAFWGKILQNPNRIFPYECHPAVIWNFQNAIYRRCINIQRRITLTFGSEAQPSPPPLFPLLQS